MTATELESLFDSIYKNDKASLDEFILESRNNGASQLDLVIMIKRKLDLTLKEADDLVMNSAIWRDTRAQNLALREEFSQTLNEISEQSGDNPNERVLWEKDKKRDNLVMRLLRKLGF